MKKIALFTLLLVVGAAGVGCSMVGSLTGLNNNGNMTTVAQLWPDVPKMDGLTASKMDMPLPVKLVMNTIFGNLGLLNGQGQDRTTGNVDWIAYTTPQPPDAIKTFYTPDKMTAAGWQQTDQSTCVSGADQGVSQIGLFCVFQKMEGSQQTQLVIIAAPDDTSKQTNVFFIRLQETATPAPTP